ncbi:MAG: undecaprenyl-phosphate glucose phosphotransferase [Pseudomonadota bacterium]|nr:undecaprenyl-phosphate glucose phosphotransferase [Pseudomonadota bacterium]
MVRRGMAQQHAGIFEIAYRLLDFAMIAVTAWAAHWLYLGTPSPHALYLAVIGFGLVLAAWLFPAFDVYVPWRGASTFEEVRRISLAWAVVMSLLLIFFFATQSGAEFSRVWIGLWSGSAWLCLILNRMLLRAGLRWARRRGYNLRRIVIVGSTELGAEIAQRIAMAPWAGLRVEGFFTDEVENLAIERSRVLGTLHDLPGHVGQDCVDQVWIAMALKDEDRVREILYGLRHSTVDIKFVPDMFGFRLINHSTSEFAGLPILNLSASPMRGTNRLVKAIEDKLLASLILLFISPLLLLLAISVKFGSPGPVFYRQERVGWNGRPFMMLKFRSMPVNVEAGSGPVWARANENRATPFGAFLRRTSLDELPQFLNVLKGDMSIVGPRPERPVFVEKFKDEIPGYMKKHLVKAGITGWAQVNGWRGDTDLAKRIEYDLYYIEHWSLWFDLGIIFQTLFRGFVHKNAY